MGNLTIQETSFFNDKREKQGKNWKNRGKITKKQEKTGKNRKLQEIQKQDFDEILENAGNGNENKNNVFSNVTIRRFESKNNVSVQAYLGPGSQRGNTLSQRVTRGFHMEAFKFPLDPEDSLGTTYRSPGTQRIPQGQYTCSLGPRG